ncbi:uncharacterized protein EV420DRAFT_1646937 [Desarmillaria tabescens]|uniref:HNH nuclease domain-containing protein n=1 Tax=Armillaria tabescens TaxID=1929756 RepID=A0AA39MXE8_ARMTA|nr:uncharacterized protein EV420DRAFT_1646937 [Desarmillaria tabescens]KAK0449614.1 hypothetical protein EV420DRAFT_1646937 [Desarmillaria tabescens]
MTTRERKQRESTDGIVDMEMTAFLERNDIHIYLGHALIFGFCSNKYVTYRTVLRALTCGVFQFRYPLYRLGLIPYDPSGPLMFPECRGSVDFEQNEYSIADIMPAGCYEIVDEYKKIRLERSDCFLVQTPVRTRSLVTPKAPTEVQKEDIKSLRVSTSDNRTQSAQNGDQGLPSEVQSRARASDAPARTWKVHGKCAFTGQGPALSINSNQPSNVQIMHIWKHSYLDLWREANLEQYCTDPGPATATQPSEHRYLGYHKICSLSNTCAVRCDILNLLDDNELSIDSTNRHLLSFSKGLVDYTEYQYDVRHITRIYQPAPKFWELHFLNCVMAHCICPSIRVDLEEEEERVEGSMGTLQGAASTEEDGGRVDLTGGGFWASKRRRDAHATAMQYFDEESGVFYHEIGAGKDAMEDYIAQSLTIPHPGPLLPPRIANLDDMEFA